MTFSTCKKKSKSFYSHCFCVKICTERKIIGRKWEKAAMLLDLFTGKKDEASIKNFHLVLL